MKIGQNQIMKHLGLMTKALGIAPVIIILSYLCSKQYDMQLFGIHVLGIMIAGYLGYMQLGIKTKLEQRLQTKSLELYVAIGISYIISIALLGMLIYIIPVTDFIMKMIVGVTSGVIYISFMKIYWDCC